MANIRTIDYKGFNHATGSQATGSGWMLWSGSMELSKSGQSHTNTDYYGVGMEMIQDSASYLRYQSKTGSSAGAGGELEIVTPKFFLGSPSSFISGSGTGEIAISSSNFELTNQGDVTMLGTITAEAGGTIGGFNIGSTSLSTTAFQLSSSQNGTDPVSFISSSQFKVSSQGQVTASAVQISGKVTATSGEIGGWDIVSSYLMAKNNTGGIKLNGGSKEITFRSGSSVSTEFGFLGNLDNSAGPVGIRFNTPGTNELLFEISEDLNKIAGWSFDKKAIFGGDMYIDASGSITSSNNWAISSSTNSTDPAGFISSSAFKVSSDGRITASAANIEGKITATSGDIGGFNITSTGLNSDSGEFQITGSTGQITGSKVLFTAGQIAGWHIESDFLKSNNSSIIDITLGNDSGMYFDGGSTPQIYLNPGNGSVNEYIKMYYQASDDFGIQAKSDASGPTFQLGSTNQIAGWTFDNEQLTGGNLIIRKDGTIQTSDYASNLMGFQLSAVSGGYLEVENAKIRGTLATAVFEKESVNAVGGQLYVANSTVLTSSATHPAVTYSVHDTTMSVENVTGFTHGEVLSIKKVSTTGFTTEYVQVNSSSRESLSSETNFAGNLMVTRSLGFTGGSVVNGNSGSLGGTPANSQSYSGSQVIVSTGKIGTGFIRLNANPNDTTTPYIDIVERTGSGIYDIELKARLGDLSGVASTGPVPADPGFGLFSENVFLSGTITASAGKIGGLEIGSTFLKAGTKYQISSSENENDPASFISSSNFKVSADGRVTASGINVDGTISSSIGNIGGFTIGSSTISTTAFQFSSSQVATDPVSFISSSNFKVSSGGTVTASNMRLTGVISSSEGNIGGLTIGSSAISTTAFKISSSTVTTDPVSFISSSDFKVSADGRMTASAGLIAGWKVSENALESKMLMINSDRGYISSSGAAIGAGQSNFGWRISASDDTDDLGGFISSSGFNVSPGGLASAVNFSETMVIVTQANSSSYFSNNNNYSGASDGVRLIFDGSGGGKVTMNMQLDTVPWNTSIGAGGAQRPISDIKVPLSAANTRQSVNLIINVAGVEFTDDGPIAPDIDDYLSR